MLMLMDTTDTPCSMILSISALGTSLGWASFQFISRISSRRAMFSSDDMMASRNGLPSVLLPRFSTLTIGDLSSSQKYSTILFQCASFLSAPSWWPKKSAGAGILRDITRKTLNTYKKSWIKLGKRLRYRWNS